MYHIYKIKPRCSCGQSKLKYEWIAVQGERRDAEATEEAKLSAGVPIKGTEYKGVIDEEGLSKLKGVLVI